MVEQFFTAIQPAQLDALATLLAEQQAERERLIQNWEERMKRARYEARLAERQYQAVDPENRLVAAELERRWEEKLRQLQETQANYDRFLQTLPAPQIPPELREQFRQISVSLPHLWHTEQISMEQKKGLVRTLIDYVVLRRTPTNSIEIKIVWVSGHYSVVEAHPPVYRTQDLYNIERMAERIHALWQDGKNDEAIAMQLTQEGFRSAPSLSVLPTTVLHIRLRQGWKAEHPKIAAQIQLEGYLSITDLANQLSVHRSKIVRRIYNHTIPSSEVIRHPVFKTSYLIRSSPELLERLKQDLSQSPYIYERI